MEPACEQAVQPIAEARYNKDHKCPEIASVHKMDDDERNKNHPQ